MIHFYLYNTFFLISCFNLLKTFDFEMSWVPFCTVFQLADTLKRGVVLRGQYVFGFYYYYFLFCTCYLSQIFVLQNGNEWWKRRAFIKVAKETRLLWFPPGQSFGSGTFFNKEITSKKIPIRYFEFNYIFTKRDCYVVNLYHVWNYCIYKLLEDVKEISRGCIFLIAEW